MILFAKKTKYATIVIVLYFIIILFSLANYTDSVSNFFVNIFFDKFFMYIITPLFLIITTAIDSSVLKPTTIRGGSRKKSLLILLSQQYIAAFMYLCIWFALLMIFSILMFPDLGGVNLINIFTWFLKYLLFFILIINISITIKKLSFKIISSISYVFTYLLAIVEIFLLYEINKYLIDDLFFVFSWVFTDNQYSFIALLILTVVTTCITMFCNTKYDII